MTAIIILNWNGYRDTIECLESLRNCKGDFFVVLADNGSTDNSIHFICEYLKKNEIVFESRTIGDKLKVKPSNHSVVIYDMQKNLGFAKGNNEALRMIAGLGIEYYLLLNNDTIVEPDFLQKLENFQKHNSVYKVLTPLICYESKRDIVWNAGGKLFCGFRKYYYGNQSFASAKKFPVIDISFVTGCALFFPPEILNEEGGVFTERFFFGEEDFCFCLRMNKEHHKMACVTGSLIYHKVGSSTVKQNVKGKIYIYYLNRFIDVRLHSSASFYVFWSIINSIYMVLLLSKRNFGFVESLKFIGKILKNAKHKDSVTRKDFIAALSQKA